jgi:hypothetical protein
MVMPSTKLTAMPIRPTVSDTRPPYSSRDAMSRPSRSVPSRNRVPPSAGQIRCSRPGITPQNMYGSPRQKKRIGCGFVRSAVYSRRRVSRLR